MEHSVKLLILIAFVLSQHYSFAFWGQEKKDSAFVDKQIETASQVAIKGEPHTALKTFQEAYRLSIEIGYQRGETKAMLNIGEVLYNRAAYDTALVRFKKSLALAQQYRLPVLEAKAYNYIGKYYHSKGDFNLSLKNYLKSYAISKTENDTLGLISIQNKLGKHFSTLGDHPKALSYFLSSEGMLHHCNSEIEKASTYNHLGNLFQKLKDYRKAMLFHNKALYIRKQMAYREGIAKSLKNIGEVYLDTKQPDSAMRYFEESLQICKEISYAKGIVKNIHSQGITLKQLNDTAAIGKFKLALKYSEEVGYQIGVIRAICKLADIYTEIGDFDQAIQYSQDGLKIALQEDMKSHIEELYETLAQTYKEKNDYEKAYAFLEKQMAVQNQLANPEINKKLAELQTEYEISLKEQENEMLKKENQIQELTLNRKNIYIIFVIITLILLSLLMLLNYSRYLQKKKANVELQALNHQLTIAKAQQVKLFSIISHELRNPLFWFRNLIQLLTNKIDVMDKEMVAKSLQSLNESATNTFHLMDNLLHWSRSQLGNITYKPEPLEVHQVIDENIQLIRQYADHKNISINYDSPKGVTVMADKAMTKTVIRNLLSNALKFTPNNGSISIEVQAVTEKVVVKIIDNGKGMEKDMVARILHAPKNSYIPTSAPETGSGIGLSVTKEFIELNGGVLQVNSTLGKGSTFCFDIPLN